MNTNETNLKAQSPAPVAVPPAPPVVIPPPPVTPIESVKVTPAAVPVNPVAAKPKKGGKKNKVPAAAMKK
jgi:hypothetical protein